MVPTRPLHDGKDFRRLYAREVRQDPEQLDKLSALARQGPITFIFSAHDENSQ